MGPLLLFGHGTNSSILLELVLRLDPRQELQQIEVLVPILLDELAELSIVQLGVTIG